MTRIPSDREPGPGRAGTEGHGLLSAPGPAAHWHLPVPPVWAAEKQTLTSVLTRRMRAARRRAPWAAGALRARQRGKGHAPAALERGPGGPPLQRRQGPCDPDSETSSCQWTALPGVAAAQVCSAAGCGSAWLTERPATQRRPPIPSRSVAQWLPRLAHPSMRCWSRCSRATLRNTEPFEQNTATTELVRQ
jgi:hypothetical protein